ncbi:MAG: class I SAM-dependent methyltransferase [Dehalococcoidia bacterium]|nr:class I SAM-dependent methyltransferase [Dehalococcoidia bacterium]
MPGVESEPGGWERWQWDATLFAGAAPYYERGRLPYAPGLADALRDALALDGRGRLLDLGCGPGTVTFRLAHLFEEAIGLDPDAGMLDEARRAAAERGVPNVRWVCERAEALPAGLGLFRVVTLAASFHWMDRPRVARATRGMLEPGGAAVQVDAPAYRPGEFDWRDLPYGPPPQAAIEALTRRFLGPGRRAGQSVRNTSPSGEDAVFQAAGFAPGKRVIVPDGRVVVRTEDDVVAQTFSSSHTAPHLFGDRLAEFETALRGELREASPKGRFAVRLPDNVLTVWRPRAERP